MNFFSNKRKQFWPKKDKYPVALKWFLKYHSELPKINSNTTFSSIGSCFAREIKNWLIKNNYNYLIGNENDNFFHSKELFPGDGGASPSSHASVAWERVYNTFTLKNIIDYSLGIKEFPERFLQIKSRTGDSYVSDILRSRIIYKSRKSADNDLINHTQQSKDILGKTEIFIITLGLIEIWEHERNGYVLAAHPGNAYKIPDEFKPRVSTYNENLDNINYVIKELTRVNTDIKIILTVSPVHLRKTERKHTDVISASCYSKSLLRVVAESASQSFNNVYYFPSYEIATIVSNLDNLEVYPDNHHVNRDIVDNIMDVFKASTSGLRIF